MQSGIGVWDVELQFIVIIGEIPVKLKVTLNNRIECVQIIQSSWLVE